MQLTITVPDDLTAALTLKGADPAQAALEAMALEAYRKRRTTAFQLRTLLGISSRFELDGYLKERRIETYTAEDFEHDLDGLDPLPTAVPRA